MDIGKTKDEEIKEIRLEGVLVDTRDSLDFHKTINPVGRERPEAKCSDSELEMFNAIDPAIEEALRRAKDHKKHIVSKDEETERVNLEKDIIIPDRVANTCCSDDDIPHIVGKTYENSYEKKLEQFDTINEEDYKLWNSDFEKVLEKLFTIDEVSTAAKKVLKTKRLNVLYKKWLKVLRFFRINNLSDDDIAISDKFYCYDEYQKLLTHAFTSMSMFTDENVEKIRELRNKSSIEGIMEEVKSITSINPNTLKQYLDEGCCYPNTLKQYLDEGCCYRINHKNSDNKTKLYYVVFESNNAKLSKIVKTENDMDTEEGLAAELKKIEYDLDRKVIILSWRPLVYQEKNDGDIG